MIVSHLLLSPNNEYPGHELLLPILIGYQPQCREESNTLKRSLLVQQSRSNSTGALPKRRVGGGKKAIVIYFWTSGPERRNLKVTKKDANKKNPFVIKPAN